MVTRPDPVALYPDVAAHGSLSAALRAVAREGFLAGEGFFSAPVGSSADDPLRHAAVESTLPHRNALIVNSWTWKRRWSIRGEESYQGMALVQGATEDLTQVARAAQAWHDGVALGDIRRTAPFVELTGRFEVPDNDPLRLTESEWRHLRTEADTLESPGEAYRALVEAAYAEPALRALYPFTSHWTLRFSTTTRRRRLSDVGLCLFAHDVDRYTVGENLTNDSVFARATTAREAVAAAVRHLRPGLGPVTLEAARVGD
ncbi:DUF6193 family natural product biosynthesis protein [Streptomyces sp. NPDC012510]|uniref:DUF6193 family natural product biosynthesis protein n=1 Tax=Streptomyces sp. NPDC012510 TaxID=3364838 RepID=UPI0036E35F48